MKNKTLKTFLTMILVFFAIIVIVPAVSAADIYVPDNYATIQAAVNAANDGDTIIVRDGVYNENIDVGKRLAIKSENGSKFTIVQAPNPNDPVFEITADYVNISGFTVEGANKWPATGIHLENTNYCTISYNNVLNSTFGISLDFSSNNTVTYNNNASINFFESFNNMLINNKAISIWISCSSDNTLKNNKMHSFGLDIHDPSNISEFINFVDTSNKVKGKPLCYWIDEKDKEVPSDAGYVALVNCTNVTVKDATITGNGQGIVLAYTENSKIENVNASNNWDFGIGLYYSSNNKILNSNTSNEGGWCGISLRNSTYNAITNNIASNNDLGISLCYSSNNTLTNNIVDSNDYYGIDLDVSPNNTIRNNLISSNNKNGICLRHLSNNNTIYLNNFINNTDNVYSSYSTNTWNSTEKITYTYNGNTYTNYMGNYWDDYTDVDADNDGIWDNPRSIDSDCDYHSLVEPFENYLLPVKLLNVPFFSQRNPAWKDKKLDHSPYSIGGYGCALTSVAMASKYFGSDTDPDRLNTSLTEVGGLDIYGILHWEKVEHVTGGKVKWIGWAGGNWERIDHELSERNPVIANISYPTTGYPYHFIVFIGKIDEKYYFLDPYDEQKEIRAWPNGKLGKYSLKNLRIYHGASSITITAYSPVDVVVNDPDNLTISKQSNEIPGASYTEVDINGDDDPDDIIFIPYRKTGEYLIGLTPEADTSPDEKYTLVVSTETANTTLAENVSIREIPTEPYVFESAFYFDTGSPANPYPSIFGIHNGTITPNQTITISKLYTYSCTGTGGHTEYARIWNNSGFDATAKWEGYKDDWRNISFDKTFTLVANETYNYTLRTGSYPQIIHEREFDAIGGTINCSEFIDANGKRYVDWIPAIRLE